MRMFCGMPQVGLASQFNSVWQIINPLRTVGTCSISQHFVDFRRRHNTFSSLEGHYRTSHLYVSIKRINVSYEPLYRKSWNGFMHTRNFSVTPVQHMFWEKDAKGGYQSKEKHSKKKLIREGLKELRGEIAKWQDEVKEKFECDPLFVRPGDMDIVWELKTEDDLQRWVATCDSDHGEGFSSGGLSLSPTGHGLFSGEISTRVPKDGIVKKAGYVNIRSMRPRKSFKRDDCHDWTIYNTLELRVRGDGRSYMVNLSTAGYFDLTWADMYNYPLYTRGGPHWQVTRIPFSKFFLSSKGRTQDKQSPLPRDRIVSVGVTAGDRINAPFRLEIDYIGVYWDPDHIEEFAYEMYQLPKFYIH